MSTLVLERRVVRALMVILVLLQIGFFIAVYVSAGLLGQLTYPNFFISNALSLDPGRAVGAFVLPITATIILIVVGARHFRMYRSFSLTTKYSSKLFWFSLFCLIVACLTMVGVSAVAIHTNRWVHWIIAAIMFLSGVFLVVSLPFLDRSLQLIAPRWLVRFRQFIATSVAVTAILLGATIGWQKLIGSVAEIVVSVLFMVYFLTLAHQSEFPLISRVESINLSPKSSPPPNTRVITRRTRHSRSNSDSSHTSSINNHNAPI